MSVVDGFDGLPQGLEEPGTCPRFFAFAGRAQQLDPGLVHRLLEAGTVLVPVADEELAVPAGTDPGHRRGVGEDVQEGLAFVGLGPGQGVPDRQPVQGADQVQPQAPEVA